MIHPLKFMLLFSETPYCGPHCLHDRRVTVTQECWARCRVIPSDASPLPKARSIATIGQSASNSLKYHTPDLNYQHRPLSRLHFSSSSSSFFNSINNTKCKSLEQMLREKKDRRRTGEDEEEGKQKEGGGKNTSGEQNNPAGPPLPLQASEVTLCFCEGACEQNGLWSWATALYCGITTATTKPLQKCAGWL